MAIVLHHHPFSRASSVIWMLEEVGAPYELRFVDIMKGQQKSPELVALNPMGKLPTLVDGDTVVTEVAAIALYLGDRYSYGKLAPTVDDPARGPYFRWSCFAPSVIEPGVLAKMNDWKFKDSQAGWGNYEAMTRAMHSAIEGRDFILGDRFSMADCVFGGTVRYMLRFKMVEATPTLAAYAERIAARPASVRSDERNLAVMREHGLNP
jgi:glutathione S-transferase